MLRGQVRRELAWVAVLAPIVAVAATWPALRRPHATVPQDLVDPLYFVWQTGWVGHALRAGADLWTTNAFSRAPGSLAYTDAVLGYAPLAVLADGHGTAGALVAYNVSYVLAVTLALAGGYLLGRSLGCGVPGALVVAAACALAPWRLAHVRHLNVISTGGVTLALACLVRGHGWSLRSRPARPRPGWILAGWVVACWQLTFGFAVGIPFAYVLLLVLLAGLGSSVLGPLLAGRRRRAATAGGSPRIRAVAAPALAHAVGGGAFALTAGALALPYLRVVQAFPVAERTEEMVRRYSPTPVSLVTAPEESRWWRAATAAWRADLTSVAEQALFPGLVLVLLAAVGLVYSAWTVRARVLLAAGAVMSTLLALGTGAPGGGRWTFLLLFRHLPGWDAVRTPGRLMFWVVLCLALLAAGAVTGAVRAVPARRPGRRPGVPVAVALAVLPGLAIALEGAARMPQPVVPAAPVRLADLPGPVLVLPSSQQGDFLPMTWSTDGWPVLVSGGSGFEPPTQSRLRRAARKWPTPAGIAELRGLGVRTVVVDLARTEGTDWEAAGTLPGGGLGPEAARALGVRVREEPLAVIVDLG